MAKVSAVGGEASESVALSFRDQSASRKESYELDCCYDQNEDNGLIFSREVKPLILGVFEGCNATFIALEASLIQPQLSTQVGDIPQSNFQFDFDYKRKVLAEAEKEFRQAGDGQPFTA